MDVIDPHLFHAAQQMPGPAEPLFQTMIEIVVKELQLLPALVAGEADAFNFSRQEGIAQQAPADHPAVHRGAALLQLGKTGKVYDIAVVDQPVGGTCGTRLELIQMSGVPR